MTNKPTIFQSETCGRCGGSGRYSYNQMHGSTCYGCSGKGSKLTKAGRAAYDFYLASVSKPARDVVVGNKIWESIAIGSNIASGWMRIHEINVAEDGKLTLICNHSKLGRILFGSMPDALVQVAPTTEERDLKIAAALAFQATLGKNGKPLRAKEVA